MQLRFQNIWTPTETNRSAGGTEMTSDLRAIFNILKCCFQVLKAFEVVSSFL